MPAQLLQTILDNPALAAGWFIIGGLVIQVGLLVGGGAQRLFAERKRTLLTSQRLAMEIRAAELKIQTVEQSKTAWNGIRKFEVEKKVEECGDTYSFYLRPHDRRPLPPFKPGQYLTFQLNVPSQSKPVIRCYSLSDSARTSYYRVTIKRCLPPPDTPHPPGLGSSLFCDAIKPGDILDVKAPSGHFYLDVEKERPVVLISGGIGVTPMVAMANALVESGSAREIWFFFGSRNSSDHMFQAYMEQLSERHSNVRMHVCYSKPKATDVKGRDYHHEGRVTVDLFKELLPSNNYEYFLCGPGPFMQSITEDLRSWGVPDDWVHYEAFGPASVKRAAKPEVKTAAPFSAAGIEVSFAKSGRKAAWQGGSTSVLDLAEEAGVKIDAGCRAGNCGSCLVAVKSGQVEYLSGHGADVERGSCLACICRPKTALVIDA